MSRFQPNDISWSYRIRGSVALSQMKTNIRAKVLSRNHPMGKAQATAAGVPKSGPFQPPRNTDDGNGRDVEHVDVLGEEEQRESKTAVLGVETTNELLFGFDEVKRRPVRLGDTGDEEDHERRHQGRRSMPAAR